MMNNSSIANVLFNTVVVDELQIYYLQAFLTRLGVFFSYFERKDIGGIRPGIKPV